MKRLDAKRANMGQNPLTAAQTRLAGTAANQQRAVTPEPEQGFFGDVASNIADIASAIPHLPVTLFREAQAIRELPQAFQALPETGNSLERVGNIAQLPGVRFVPGSFVASQFGTGQPGMSGVINNPVISALDVLPYFSKAAKLSTTVKTAEDLAEAARPVQALTGAPTRTPAISTFVRNYRPGGPVVETVQKLGQPVERLAPNPIGKAMDTLKSELTGSRNAVTRTLGSAFGQESRFLARSFQRLGYDASLGDLRGYGGITPDDELGASIAARARNEVDAIREEFKGQIAPERQQTIYNSAVRDQLDDLTDTERAYLTRIDDAQQPIVEHLVNTGQLERLPVAGQSEIYDIGTAAEIKRRRYLEGRQAGVAKLRAHLDPRNEFRATPDDLLTDFRTMLADENVSKGAKVQLARGYLTGLDDMNIDVSALRKELAWRGGKASDMRDWVIPDDLTPRATPYNPAVVGESLTELKRLRSNDPIARDLYRALSAKRFTEADATMASDALRKLSARKKFPTALNVDDLRNEITRRRQTITALHGIERAGGSGGKKMYSDSLADIARKRREITERKAVPARFAEPVRQALDEKLLAEKYDLLPDADPTTLANFDTAVMTRNYDELAELGVPIGRMRSEARQSWQDLRAQGMEPVFMHSVSKQRARSLIDWPRVTDNSKLTLSQTKARLWDAGPQTGDVAIAVEARAMEYLMQQGSKAFADDILTHLAKSSDQVIAEYRPIAIKRIERRGGDVTSELQQELTDLIARDKTPFDPDSFVNGRSGGKAENRAPYYLPKTVGNSLDKLSPPPSDLLHALNKPMKLFRTSVLPLSPRWHVYNILGGAVMLLGRADNPVTIMKYARDAYRMTRDGGLHHLMQGVDDLDTIRASRMAPPGEVGNRAARMDVEYALQDYPAEHLYAGGGTLRRLWDSANTKKVLRDPFNKLVEKSYDANMWFDDFYRSMAYLEGSGGARKMGLSRSAQVAKGIESARNILQNWDTLTPMERSVLRFVFPFYGWCLDETSEVLTDRGWVSGWDLTETDRVLSCDPADNTLKWSAVRSIFRNPDYYGPMHHLVNRGIDQLVTPGHSFLTDRGLVGSFDLHQTDRITLMGSAEQSSSSIFSDAFVELVGWAVTEGHYRRNSSGNITTVEISQKDGTATCDQIRHTLKRAGANFHEYLAGVDKAIRYFGVTGPTAQQILAVAPNRVMSHEFLLGLSTYQRHALIDVMIAADGSRASRNRGDCRVFAQKDPTATDRFVMLCTLAGIPTYTAVDGDIHRVTLRGTTGTQVRRIPSFASTADRERPFVMYRGLVWCPETEFGTFVMRRNGKVQVTGNTRHLLSYVTKYPADHPWRMSIMANIAEAEMTDANSGLPRSLRGLLFYGDVDMDGKQSAINLDGANPFRDVANWVTLAGFVAGQGGDAGAITTQLNPLLSTPLQLMGVDTRSGTADLFPTLQFDNATGQLIAAPQDNPLMLGFGNLFPQGRGMTQLLGLSREYNDLMSTNPDAAQRLLRSSFGFPVMRRDIDVPTETMKAELTRSQAQKDKINAAVKSGDYGALTQAYPGLTPFAKRMMLLSESQKASKYQAVEGPGNEGNSVRDILMGSLAKLPV